MMLSRTRRLVWRGVHLLARLIPLESFARLALVALLPARMPREHPTERALSAPKSRSAPAATVDGMAGQQGLRTGSTPLAVRMRPTSLDEVAGQQHLLQPGSPLVQLADDASGESGSVSVILWGPPGTGKTTLAQAIAHSSGRRFVELSAVTAGVKDVREVMEKAHADRDLYGVSTVLFLDEIHRFTKAQQDALLPGVENGWVILIAATTENPSFSVDLAAAVPVAAAHARAAHRRRPRRAGRPRGRPTRAASTARSTLEDDARAALIRLASGDARRALTALEAAAASLPPTPSGDGDPSSHRRHRRRDGRPRPAALRPPGRRALRRHQRVHQVDPRVRRRRRRCTTSPA